MTHRYSLRFETGERRGETIPITGPRFTVGRKPGNSLQVLESSVSGQHAEIHIDSQGVLVRDVGSTNGTHVGAAKILETRLDPGTQVSFGNVTVTLLDTEAAVPPASAPSAPILPVPQAEHLPEEALATTMVQEAPATGQVTAEKLARARRGSKTGLLLFVFLAGIGGMGAWFVLKGGGTTNRRAVREVVEPAGNVLAGYSFEGDSTDWAGPEEAAASFYSSAGARYSGDKGLAVTLDAGETAFAESPAVPVSSGRPHSARAFVRAGDGVLCRIGLQFSSSSAAEGASSPGPTIAWSGPVEGEAEWTEVNFTAVVPEGYDRLSAVVVANAATTGDGGEVELDDVSVVAGSTSVSALELDEYRFRPVGDPATVASLFKVDRVLVSGLRIREGADGIGRGVTELSVEPADNGVLIRHDGDGGAILSFRAEAGALRRGLASIADDGYRPHSVDFEREGVTDVLLGSGVDLVRLSFDQPVSVTARSAGDAFRFTIGIGSSGLLLQLRFQEERTASIRLAADADAAEARGDLGECLEKWQELLDRFPFEESKVQRAEQKRAELVRRGLDEIRLVAQEVERARFFRLVDIYRQCRDSAVTVATRYAGSEVEKDAIELIAEIDAELATLEADLDRHEVDRLRSILDILEAQKAKLLAEEVRRYLREHYAEDED